MLPVVVSCWCLWIGVTPSAFGWHGFVPIPKRHPLSSSSASSPRIREQQSVAPQGPWYRHRPRHDATSLKAELQLSSHRSNSSNCGKKILLVRHGCTYMNEYLAEPGKSWGAPNFTDVFPPQRQRYYRDTPLSPRGEGQARQLARDFRQDDDVAALNLDLIVSSPLSRALQTVQFGLLPSLAKTPVEALPLAAERLFLISDVGTPRRELRKRFNFVDFTEMTTAEEGDGDESWWFTVAEKTEREKPRGATWAESMLARDYQEWRPRGNGQTYACRGEPQEAFDRRMMRLVQWLEGRPEQSIALVSHWAVLSWLTGGADFENCEYRVVSMKKISQEAAKRQLTAPWRKVFP